MKCPNCNGEVENGQKFCDHCGMRLPEDTQEERKTEPVKQEKSEKVKSEKKKIEKEKPEKAKTEEKNGNIAKKILIPVCMVAICLISFLGTVMFMKPKSVRTDSLQQKLDLGNKYLASAEYEKAEVAFSEALKIDKKSPDAAMGLAKIYNETDKPEKALNMLEKASGNMQSISKNTTSRQRNEYQKVYQHTSDLFRNKGDMEKAVQTEDLYEEVKVYVVVTPEPDEKTYVAELDREETEESDEEPVISDEGSDINQGMIQVDFPEKEEPSVEEEELTEQEYSDETIMEILEDNSESGENVELSEKIEDVPAGGKEESSAEEIPDGIDVMPDDIETSDEPEQIIYDTEDIMGDEFWEEYPEISDENVEEIYGEENYLPEDYNETEEMSEEITEEEISSENLLYDYANDVIQVQNPGYDIDGCTVDISNTGSLDGTLGYHIEDLNGDGEQELLLISVLDGILVCDPYHVENGEVIPLDSTIGLMNSFGGYTEGLSYGVTQECFITNSGDIGIASHYYGKVGDDGNPSVETTAVLYRLGGDGSCVCLGGATIVNGSIIREGGASSGGYEGNADTFCSLLNQCGLNGSWIYDSTNTLEQMGLEENPYQDMAAVPNPVRGGIATYEGGQDLVIVNAEMSAEDTSMYISVQDYTGF